MRVLVISDRPARTTHATRRAGPGVGAPLQRRGTGTFRCGIKFPSAEGWCALRDGVVYSIAQGCSNSYMPVVSVYDTPTGAYIIHDPPGLDAIQLVAVPADV